MRLLFFLPTFCSGGAEAFVVNVAEELTRRGYICSILSIDGEVSVYDSRLNAVGVRRECLIASRIENPAVRYFQAYKLFARYLKKHAQQLDAIHFNVAQGEELPFVWMAKRAGIVTRILHSHNSFAASPVKLAGHYLCKSLFPCVATRYCACSDKAAEWLLPKPVLADGDYQIINNGISTERFRFRKEWRESVRQKMRLGSSACYICVGRLDHQKNHTFLLKAFRAIREKNPSAILLLVGEGPLEESLHSQASSLGIADSIHWLGVRNDVNVLLSAADCFLLSSEFEGFPFTLVEAQASGLPCVISDRVSQSCAITNLLTYSPLDVGAFSTKAIAATSCDVGSREAYADIVKDAGYDIISTVNTLESFYLATDNK